MGLADDLLQVADRLANPSPTDPEQASLRRSVSTAYYALFHLLVGEAAQLWTGGSPASQLRLERAFEHTTMKQISDTFSKGEWTDWTGQKVPVPPELQAVAGAFVSLQQARHAADYDGSKYWPLAEVQSYIDDAREALRQWQTVRTQPIAQDFLLSFLVGTKRR